MLEIDPITVAPDTALVLPGSKSITNRALIAAGLASGTSTLSGALFAEDTLAMMDCLEALGATIDRSPETATVRVTGVAGRPVVPTTTLWSRQSGTTARFVLPVASLCPGQVIIDGDEQLRARPQGPLLSALEELGGIAECLGVPGHLPVRVGGSLIRGGEVSVAADTSSQFVSGLLLAAPAMPEGLRLILNGPMVSAPYIAMSIAVMRSFGAKISESGDAITVEATGYRSRDYEIEPDASAASYFFAAAAITGGRVTVDGLGSSSLQGDRRFVDLLGEMGATVTADGRSTTVIGSRTLDGIDVDMSDCSDTAPTLAAIAPLCGSAVRARGIGFIRHKETDRIAAVVSELNKLGVVAVEHEDGFEVSPGKPAPAMVSTYDDHRMAMAFTVLGLVTPGIVIEDPSCVAKTFPGFFDVVDLLRAPGDAGLAIVALDGPAGSGKSTVARLVAEALGLEYLDTGAMYRSVAFAATERGIDLGDVATVADLGRHLDIDVGRAGVSIDGVDVTLAIRSAAVNAAVSQVAANSGVRAALRRQQRAWARRRGGGVLEGRDIGSVVFPQARLKVYLRASAVERARRRSAESGRSYEEILAEIESRDAKDSSRDDSPLVEADGATTIDTTRLTVAEVVSEIVGLFG